MYKLVIIIDYIFFTVLISSCTSTKTKTELSISHNCNDSNTCEIELVEATTNFLVDFVGKEHALTKKILKNIVTDDLVWSGINYYAFRCGDGAALCTSADNPTAGIFASGDTPNVSVSGTVSVNGVSQTITNLSTGGSWTVPISSTSVTYVCPGGLLDTINYGPTDNTPWVASNSLITVIQTGSGVNCHMQFSCPSSYIMANNAKDVSQGSDLLGSAIQDSATKNLFIQQSGGINVLRFFIQSGSGQTIDDAGGSYGNGFAYYANSDQSPAKVTLVSCVTRA